MAGNSPNKHAGSLFDELNVLEDQKHLNLKLAESGESVFFSGVLIETKSGVSSSRLILVTNKRICYLRKSFSCSVAGLFCLLPAKLKLCIVGEVPVSEFVDLTINSKRFSVVMHLRSRDDLLFTTGEWNDSGIKMSPSRNVPKEPIKSQDIKSSLRLEIAEEQASATPAQMSVKAEYFSDKYRALLTALNQVYYLAHGDCITIYQVVGFGVNKKNNSAEDLYFLARSKAQSKKDSVLTTSQTMSSIRELAQGLEEVLSPTRTSHSIRKIKFLFPAQLELGSPVAEIYKRSPGKVLLFQAKLAAGERFELEHFIIDKPLRAGEWGREYLVKDPESGVRAVLKIISLDRMEAVFGIEFWKVQEILKIYLSLSVFLPELYQATVTSGYLMLYSQYFE